MLYYTSELRRKYSSVFKGYGGDVVLVGISYDEKEKVHTCSIERFEKGLVGKETDT